MARYIDADALLEKLGQRLESQLNWCLYNHAKITQVFIDAIKDEPTADVAPKSEVENLQAEAENLRNANADLALALLYECEPTKEHLSELEKAVREKVAMEIFEEIGKRLSIVDGHHGLYTISEADLAELKKKYKEVEK